MGLLNVKRWMLFKGYTVAIYWHLNDAFWFQRSWKLQSNVILDSITSCTFEQIHLQWSVMFSLVCYGYYLVMPQETNTISLLKFHYNVQPLNVAFKKVFLDSYNQKNVMLPPWIEICSWDLKFQWQIIQEIN